MEQTDSTGYFPEMKLPDFLNTPAKWNAVVQDIDTMAKFDNVALHIVDDEDIDIFEFRDILVKLAEDVKVCRPQDGELITLLVETVTDLLDFLAKKSEERFTQIVAKMLKMQNTDYTDY